jgi:hypothetical protein
MFCAAVPFSASAAFPGADLPLGETQNIRFGVLQPPSPHMYYTRVGARVCSSFGGQLGRLDRQVGTLLGVGQESGPAF